MANDSLGMVLRRLRRWVGGGVAEDESDAQLLERWLFGRSPHTQRASQREIQCFLSHPTLAGKALHEVTPGDVQAFAAAAPDAPVFGSRKGPVGRGSGCARRSAWSTPRRGGRG